MGRRCLHSFGRSELRIQIHYSDTFQGDTHIRLSFRFIASFSIVSKHRTVFWRLFRIDVCAVTFWPVLMCLAHCLHGVNRVPFEQTQSNYTEDSALQSRKAILPVYTNLYDGIVSTLSSLPPRVCQSSMTKASTRFPVSGFITMCVVVTPQWMLDWVASCSDFALHARMVLCALLCPVSAVIHFILHAGYIFWLWHIRHLHLSG